MRVLGITAVCMFASACGSESDPDIAHPSDDEVHAALRAYCEQPIVPCEREANGNSHIAATEEDYAACTEHLFVSWYSNRVEFDPACAELILGYVECVTGMSCDEAGAHRNGQGDECVDELHAVRYPGCMF